MRFRRASRKRRVAKWFGLTTCLLIGIVWLASLRWGFQHVGTNVTFMVGSGAGYILTSVRWTEQRGSTWYTADGFSFATWPRFGSGLFGRDYLIPLWMPLLAVGVPTFLLWRYDRRPPEGHCQSCGYDLTGNESGVCPECGTIQSEALSS